MKNLIFMIIFSLIFNYTQGQNTSSKPKKKPCIPTVVYHYSQGKGNFESIEDIKPLEPSKEALQVLQNLLKAISIDVTNETGIHLFSSDSIKSTASFIEDNQPYIIYNKNFFKKFYSPNGENWQLKFAFAHEIGHHLNGHTSINVATINRELASDKFAGWILGLLGADENEALEWMKNVDSWTDGIHPPKQSRINAVKEGLTSSKQLMKTYFGSIENENFSYTYSFGPYNLAISKKNSFDYKNVQFHDLDLSKDFRIDLKVRSTESNGSTRFGLAWNFNSSSDFKLFTLHNENSPKNESFYSIGRGNCDYCNDPWVRYKSDGININGNTYNTLTITKSGKILNFYINNSKVWETSEHSIKKNIFAFWVADYSNATFEYMKAYQ